MAASNLTAIFYAAVRSALSGDFDVSLAWGPFTPVGYVHQATLTQGGFTTITFPTAPAALVVVVPPTNNVQAVTLKGASGDTGTPLTSSAATILQTTASSLGITLGSGSNQIFTFIIL